MSSSGKIRVLGMEEYGVFPERSDKTAYSEFMDAYLQYYFNPGNPEAILNTSKGVIVLHNSWTPVAFRNMSEDKFLSTNTRLASLLRILLSK